MKALKSFAPGHRKQHIPSRGSLPGGIPKIPEKVPALGDGNGRDRQKFRSLSGIYESRTGWPLPEKGLYTLRLL